MKALSLHQPWASIIIDGPKRLENRTRRTHHRGWMLVHASQTFDATVAAWIKEQKKKPFAPVPFAQLCHGAIIADRAKTRFPQGGIIGAMEITDCIESSDSPWWIGPFGYVIRRTIKLPFFPCIGRQGPFNVDLPADIASLIPTS